MLVFYRGAIPFSSAVWCFGVLRDHLNASDLDWKLNILSGPRCRYQRKYLKSASVHFLCRSVYPRESHSMGVETHPDKLKTGGYNSNSEKVFFPCEQCEPSEIYRTSETTLGSNTWKWGLWSFYHHSHHRGDDGDVIGCSVHRPWHYDRPGFCHHRVPQPSNEDVMTVPANVNLNKCECRGDFFWHTTSPSNLRFSAISALSWNHVSFHVGIFWFGLSFVHSSILDDFEMLPGIERYSIELPKPIMCYIFEAV